MFNFPDGFVQRIALARIAALRRSGQLSHALFEAFGAVGKAFLFRRLPARPIGRLGSTASSGVAAETSLRVSQLP